MATFERIESVGGIFKLHEEEKCEAPLGTPPPKKYLQTAHRVHLKFSTAHKYMHLYTWQFLWKLSIMFHKSQKVLEI